MACSCHMRIFWPWQSRFLAIVFPLKYGVWITRKGMYGAIAAMWITWAVYVVPFLFFDWRDPANKKCVSFINEDLPIYLIRGYAIFILSVLLILMGTYVNVLRVAKLHATRVRGNPSESSSSSSYGAQIPQIIQQDTNKESSKGLKFIVAAIGACLLTWSMSADTEHMSFLRPDCWCSSPRSTQSKC